MVFLQKQKICRITRPLLINKGHISRGEIILIKTDNKTMLTEMFNLYHINIVEKTSGKKPSHLACDNKISQ